MHPEDLLSDYALLLPSLLFSPLKKIRLSGKVTTSLCSRQAIMISDKMTTPVLPTPALQWTSSGGLRLLGSLVLLVWRRTDWISSRYAVANQGRRKTLRIMEHLIDNSILILSPLTESAAGESSGRQAVGKSAPLTLCPLERYDRPEGW